LKPYLLAAGDESFVSQWGKLEKTLKLSQHYLGVIIAKRLLGYTGVTGDWFAIIVPIGIMLGRVGCFLNGCCLGRVCKPQWFTMNDVNGVARWPAVPVESLQATRDGRSSSAIAEDVISPACLSSGR
jgi:phosphatidylglycerol:prolipoprotein diacylglycerol transferase